MLRGEILFIVLIPIVVLMTILKSCSHNSENEEVQTFVNLVRADAYCSALLERKLDVPEECSSTKSARSQEKLHMYERRYGIE